MSTLQTLPIVEIFSSLQGEGLYAGQSHLFIRIHGCNLDCIGCDENDKPFRQLSIHKIIETVTHLNETIKHQYVALTGGEPLLVSEVSSLARELKSLGFRILLETNGTLPAKYKVVEPVVDVVSMDFKLNSVWSIDDCYTAHTKFLESMCSDKLYIKIVISEDIDTDEFDKYIVLISDKSKQIPVFLHPYESNDPEKSPTFETLARMQQRALSLIDDVRVAPRYQSIFKIA